jgi:dissimilatory sulfite reductase related protein
MELDAHGYLTDFASWQAQHAETCAQVDGLVLTPAHWEILQFLRQYFAEFAMAPPMRLLTKAIAAKLGQSKAKSIYLYELFPQGPAKQACRYAGLPKPISCI